MAQGRILGVAGPTVSAIGLGCMGMSEFYGNADEASTIQTIRRAIDLGVTMIDTAPSYGSPSYGEAANEIVVGRALKGRREQIVLATKVGIVRGWRSGNLNNDPAYIRREIDMSLARLGVEHVDLYYLHRRDPRVPIEDVIDTMVGLVHAGKVRHIGLSEVNAETLRRADKIHPITALQSEYSLISRHIESDVLPVARELGVSVVAYAPIARALLAGDVTSLTGLQPHDVRRLHPRFQDENLNRNLALVDRVKSIARDVGCTSAQLSLAWLLSRGTDIIPIPGTTRVQHLEENIAAAAISLTPDQLWRIEEAIGPDEVAGERNTPANLALMET